MEQIKITVNGKEILTSPDKTILEAVHENNFDKIPTLCHDKRLEHFTSCFLCVVEVEGMNKLIPSCSTKVSNGMKIQTRSKNVVESRKMALELIMSNHYADCIGPCKNNCPAGVDAQAYIALVSMGKYKEALKLVKENNPMPLSIGRVCVRDCEEACRRNLIDEAVSVNALKRFIADIDNINKWTPHLKEKKNKKVAVIGGGPAGLTCAYYLTVEGYSATIFEKLPELGGMLRYGIPEYRLPKKVLDSEIKWILDLGVEVKTGVELGKDFSIKDLFNQGYDSVFVGVGAHKATKLGLDGEEKIYGIFRGIDFLRELIVKDIPELPGTVVVVGGGNTAIDAARTALRCGADKVQIVYRRSINEMPAHHEEIEAAQKEGVEILFLTNPKALVVEDNKLKAIECLRMELVEGKPGERPKPVPVPGSEFNVECDYLISAIGQNVDISFSKLDSDCTLEKWGTVVVNNQTMETSIPGVFAGGDVVTGPLTAITSIAQGKKAALAIMGYLEKGIAAKYPGKFVSLKHNLAKPTEREFENFSRIHREKQKEIPISSRISTFEEVDKGITKEQAFAETLRCLECGCSEYYDCELIKYCNDYEINIKDFIGETKKYLADYRHPFITLDANKCINCGRCVRTCTEVLKVSALGFVYRGFKSVVKPAMEKALLETNCIACGNCIDACPTGAISEKFPFKILGTLPKFNYETVCNFCSVGCKVNYKKITDDIFYISNTTEEIKDSHNKGFLCVKGRFGHRYLMEKNRILNPSIKQNGIIQNVNYDEAFSLIEKKIKSIIEEYGNDSIAVFASPKLSNEELYLLQKFARTGLKTNNISSFSNLLFGIEQNSLDEMIGFTASTAAMDDLKTADIIVVLNSNLSEENLVMELKIKEAQKNGAKLVLINSSEIKLTKLADLWLDSKKGTNTALLSSLIKYCIDNGLYNKEYIEKRINNFEELRTLTENAVNGNITAISELDKHKLETFYKLLSDQNSKIVFIYNIDSTSDKSISDLKALGNFLLLTERIGKAGNGVLILREFNNSAGLMDMGFSPDYLPGYVKHNEKKEIKRISKLWNTQLEKSFKPVDLARKLKRGEIKGVFIFGEDPFSIKNIFRSFSGVELIIAADTYNTSTTEEADIILPLASYIEQSGTYTRCDNTVQKSSKIVKGIHPYDNWQVISKLAEHFSPGFNYSSSEDIENEIKNVNRFYKYTEDGKPWIKGYFSNGFTETKLAFAKYSIDFSTFDPVKPVIQYQENYYINSIKKKLT